MRALVTGSMGFLGRRFIGALFERGYDVIGCDMKRPGLYSDCRDVFRIQVDVDLVVHCAATVGGRVVMNGSPLDIAGNMGLDAALFQWATWAKPGRILYLSSSAAYPAQLQREPGWKLREDDIDLADPMLPDGMYGWSKLTGEVMAALAREQGVAVTVVRPFSGYGEDQDDCYPFGAFRDRALRRADPFEIWGSGDQVRDWVYADDVVEASLVMAEAGLDGPYNIGSGQPVMMYELARTICTVAGYEPEFKVLGDAPQSTTPWRCCDPTLMRTIYEPKVDLIEGISKALS